MNKVKTYNDYLNELNGRGDVIVFRGEHCSSYVLIPSGLRGEKKLNADEKMFKFVDKMKTTFGFDELTCIEIAQHFFLPTRMLDFTYSYDVALFFACYDRQKKHLNEDGKVYIFNKSKYERMLKERNYLSSQTIRNNQYIYKWLQNYIDKKDTSADFNGWDLPIFVDATQQFDRLYMQKGLFLLWGQDECSFEKILEKEKLDINDFIDIVVIDSKSKPKIMQELREKNLSLDTLFMNVDTIRNLVKEINEN